MKNHDIVDMKEFQGVRYELRVAKTTKGDAVQLVYDGDGQVRHPCAAQGVQ
jgi:hypothetical protein